MCLDTCAFDVSSYSLLCWDIALLLILNIRYTPQLVFHALQQRCHFVSACLWLGVLCVQVLYVSVVVSYQSLYQAVVYCVCYLLALYWHTSFTLTT